MRVRRWPAEQLVQAHGPFARRPNSQSAGRPSPVLDVACFAAFDEVPISGAPEAGDSPRAESPLISWPPRTRAPEPGTSTPTTPMTVASAPVQSGDRSEQPQQLRADVPGGLASPMHPEARAHKPSRLRGPAPATPARRSWPAPRTSGGMPAFMRSPRPLDDGVGGRASRSMWAWSG